MSLASQIVNKCLKITEKDNVTIFLYPHNIPLAEEIAAECFKKGADVLLNLYTEKYLLSYMKELPVESLREPSVFCKTLTENSTAEIWAGATYDPAVLRKIPPEKDAAASIGEAKAHWPLQKERKVRSLYVGLSLVTKPRAKAYGFDFKNWERVIRSASSVDHDRLADQGRKLKAALSMAKRFRIKAPGDESGLPGIGKALVCIRWRD